MPDQSKYSKVCCKSHEIDTRLFHVYGGVVDDVVGYFWLESFLAVGFDCQPELRLLRAMAATVTVTATAARLDWTGPSWPAGWPSV